MQGLSWRASRQPARQAVCFALNLAAAQGVLLAAQANRSARRVACAWPHQDARRSRARLCSAAVQRIALAVQANRDTTGVVETSIQPQCKAFLLVPQPGRGATLHVGASRQLQREAFCWRLEAKAAQGIFALFSAAQLQRRALRWRLKATGVQEFCWRASSRRKREAVGFALSHRQRKACCWLLKPIAAQGVFACAWRHRGARHLHACPCPAAVQ